MVHMEREIFDTYQKLLGEALTKQIQSCTKIGMQNASVLPLPPSVILLVSLTDM